MSDTEPNETIADDLTTYSVDDEDQLQPEDTLERRRPRGRARPRLLPQRPARRASTAHGTTAYEESIDETIDERIRQEVPDPDSAYGAPDNESGLDDDRVGGDDPDSIDAEDDWLGDNEVGDARAGRLVRRRRGRPRGRREAGLGQRRGRRRRRRLGRGGRDAHRRRDRRRARRRLTTPDPPSGRCRTSRPCRAGRSGPGDTLTAHDARGDGPAQGPPAPALHRVDARRDRARPRAASTASGCPTPSSRAGRRGWPGRPTSAAGSASSASTTPPGRACAARPTCAASCARPPQDDAAEGSRWLELQVDPTSYAPFVGGITPALEIVLDEARAVSARGRHRGRRSSSRRAGCATPSRPARSPASPPGMPVTTPGDVVGLRPVQRRAARGRSPDFAPAFAIARRAGLALVPHGGELLGAQAVMETLEHLDPDRIGHGVRARRGPGGARRRGRVRGDPRGLPGQQRRPRGLRRRRRTCRCAGSSTPASPWRSAPTTRCSSAPASPRSTPRPASSASTTPSSPRSPAAPSRAAGCRDPPAAAALADVDAWLAAPA